MPCWIRWLYATVREGEQATSFRFGTAQGKANSYNGRKSDGEKRETEGPPRSGYGFGPSRDQSKPEPGSVLRAGAICS